jgi:hypothetical protein
MQARDAIGAMAANNRKVCHAHVAILAYGNDG